MLVSSLHKPHKKHNTRHIFILFHKNVRDLIQSMWHEVVKKFFSFTNLYHSKWGNFALEVFVIPLFFGFNKVCCHNVMDQRRGYNPGYKPPFPFLKAPQQNMISPNSDSFCVFCWFWSIALCCLSAGKNVCLFAYGQTGSGKSYSMVCSIASDQRPWSPSTRTLTKEGAVLLSSPYLHSEHRSLNDHLLNSVCFFQPHMQCNTIPVVKFFILLSLVQPPYTLNFFLARNCRQYWVRVIKISISGHSWIGPWLGESCFADEFTSFSFDSSMPLFPVSPHCLFSRYLKNILEAF